VKTIDNVPVLFYSKIPCFLLTTGHGDRSVSNGFAKSNAIGERLVRLMCAIAASLLFLSREAHSRAINPSPLQAMQDWPDAKYRGGGR
jgi:hypothetical protein